MAHQASLDTDVLIKGAEFGLLSEFISVIPAKINNVGVLGAAPFVCRSRMHDHAAISYLEGLLSNFQILEPTPEEVALAAELELAAQKANVNLDVGESQLCAITECRTIPQLATGDKRAIIAIEKIYALRARLEVFAKKIISLEQLVERLILRDDFSEIRAKICAKASLDKSLSICFSCNSAAVNLDECKAGLASYIRDLRRKAANVLSS